MMSARSWVVIIILLSGAGYGQAQDATRSIPLNVGYYGPYFIQPGGKIGTTLVLKEWGAITTGSGKRHQLAIGPELGAYTRPGNHVGLVVNSDIGYRFLSPKDFFISPSIGLGYLMTIETLSTTVSLGSGETTGRNLEYRHYFLPTVNLELGHEAIARKMGWYFKLSYGGKLFSPIANTAIFAAELGLRIRLWKDGSEKENSN